MTSVYTRLFLSAAITCWCSLLSGQMFVDQAVPMGVFALISADEYGSGVSVYDFNQDGLDDITITTSFGNLILYENTGDGFDLINPGLYSPGWTKQVLWVDYDNDGDLDLFLTTYGSQIKLYKNEGNFAFSDVTVSSGLPNTANWNGGASFGDYDKDGFLDLYICQYADSNYSPVNAGMINKLYRNNGNGSFIDVTASSGIQAHLALSFQSVWLDYNNDTWPDLYVINDRIYENKLHLNNGDGTFTDVTDSAGAGYPNNDVMSNSVADYNNDGYLDIFMTNTGSFVPPRPTLLAMNNGDGTYSEVGEEQNIDVYYNSWGGVWIDADNDGWQDMYFTTSDNTSNYFFINDSGNVFIEENDLVSTTTNNPCWSVAKGDFDNNGYADIAVQSRTPNRPFVLMNQGGDYHYAKITLSGTVSNSMAIGSWVHLYHNGQAYHQYTTCGNNYLSQDSQHLIFGLGPADVPIDSVLVVYLSGHTDTYYDLPVDSAYAFTEGETYSVNITSSAAESLCEGDSTTLYAGEHATYLWSTGDTSGTISVTGSGIYYLQVANSYGMEASDSIEVLFHPNPSITYELQPIPCYGDSTGGILLVNQTQVNPLSVVWSNGMTGDSLGGLDAGTYQYTFQDINSCMASGEIVLEEPPFIVVLTESTPEYAGMMNGTIFVNAFGGTPPYSYFLNDVEVGNYIVLLSAGTYDLEIYDHNLCYEYVSVEVDAVLSLEESEKAELRIFPNPTHGTLNIRADQYVSSLEVLDLQGRYIASLSAIRENQYDITHLPPGIYFLKITTIEGDMSIKKVSKL